MERKGKPARSDCGRGSGIRFAPAPAHAHAHEFGHFGWAARFIGISGWTYAGWRRLFYPESLPPRHELAFAARHFNAIEINGMFYRMQRPENFSSWREQAPDGSVSR